MNGLLIAMLILLAGALLVLRRSSDDTKPPRSTPKPRPRRKRPVSYEAELAALTAHVRRDARSAWMAPTAADREVA